MCYGRRFLSFHAHHGRHFRLYLTPNFIWWRAYAPPRPYGPRKGSSSSSKPRRGSSSRRGTACCIKLCSNLKRCSSAWRGTVWHPRRNWDKVVTSRETLETLLLSRFSNNRTIWNSQTAQIENIFRIEILICDLLEPCYFQTKLILSLLLFVYYSEA